jgi:hypothetical protein
VEYSASAEISEAIASFEKYLCEETLTVEIEKTSSPDGDKTIRVTLDTGELTIGIRNLRG